VPILKRDGRRVARIHLDDGRLVETEHADIVLAVGPWTVEVLESSGIGLPPEHRLPVPTGLFAFQLELNSDQAAFFRDKPVFSHAGRGS
jgi:glycine/D-amino acid oxidase-like deaminating enzyme